MTHTLTIVIPIYNEEAILETEIAAMIKELDEQFRVAYEVLLVENGSFDRTREIAKSLEKQFPQVKTIYLPTAGYGRALKEGLMQSTGEFTVLFNIDFWNVPFVRKALQLQKAKNLDMVVGSKTAPGAEDTRPFMRRAITRTFNWLLKKLFGFRGTDTHGMKLARTDKLKPVIGACQTEREIFDTEFVLRAEADGLKTEEIPVVCVEHRKTVYRISQRMPRTIKDLITLFFSFRLKQFNRFGIGLTIISSFIFLASVFYGFPDSPSPWFDNGVNLGLARTYAEDGIYSLRLAPGDYINERALFISTNYPLIGWIILSFKLFGVGLAQAQIVMILFLLAFLIAASLLVARWYGARYVPWTLALIVTFLPFYGNGLSGGLGEVPGLVYLLIGVLLLDRTNRTDRTKETNHWRLVVAGAFFGLAATTKVFFLVALGALGVSELIRAARARRAPVKRWLLLALGLIMPGLIWLRSLLPAGFSVPAIQQALSYYANPYQVSAVVSENLWRFVTESTPIHFLLLLISFLISLFLRFKKKEFRYGEILLLVFVILNILFYIRTVGWYRYLFPAHLLLLALLPGSTSPDLPLSKGKGWKRVVVVTLLAALTVVQTMHLARGRADELYYNPGPRKFAAELEQMLGENADIMVIDKPELWFLLKNKNARQRMQMNPRVSFGEDIFATGDLPDYIVSGEAGSNEYLSQNYEALARDYIRLKEAGHYALFEKRVIMSNEQ